MRVGWNIMEYVLAMKEAKQGINWAKSEQVGNGQDWQDLQKGKKSYMLYWNHAGKARQNSTIL